MKNLGLKLLSLLLASTLWWVVSAPRREQPQERVVTASLSLVGVPPAFMITTSNIQSSVAVRVRGRKSDLRALPAQSLEASADLSRIDRSGEVEITLRPQHINVPEEIEVVSISPNKVRFRVEQLRRRAVAVRPYLEGTPPAGFLVGEATADPALALVEGPASQIMNITEVTTERIIMTGRTGTFVQPVSVVSDSPLVRVLSPQMTLVTVPVLAELGPVAPSAPPPPRAGTPPAEEQPSQ